MKNTMKTISIALISLSLFLTSCGKDECQQAIQDADQLEIRYNNTKKVIDDEYAISIKQFDASKELLKSQLTGLQLQLSLIKIENYGWGYLAEQAYKEDVANVNVTIKIVQDEITRLGLAKTQYTKETNAKRTYEYNKYNSDLTNIRNTCPNNPATKKYQSQI